MNDLAVNVSRLDNKAAYDKIKLRPKRRPARNARGKQQRHVIRTETHINGFQEAESAVDNEESHEAIRDLSLPEPTPPEPKKSRPPSVLPIAPKDEESNRPHSSGGTSPSPKRFSMLGRSPIGSGPGMVVPSLQDVQNIKLRKRSPGGQKTENSDVGMVTDASAAVDKSEKLEPAKKPSNGKSKSSKQEEKRNSEGGTTLYTSKRFSTPKVVDAESSVEGSKEDEKSKSFLPGFKTTKKTGQVKDSKKSSAAKASQSPEQKETTKKKGILSRKREKNYSENNSNAVNNDVEDEKGLADSSVKVVKKADARSQEIEKDSVLSSDTTEEKSLLEQISEEMSERKKHSGQKLESEGNKYFAARREAGNLAEQAEEQVPLTSPAISPGLEKPIVCKNQSLSISEKDCKGELSKLKETKGKPETKRTGSYTTHSARKIQTPASVPTKPKFDASNVDAKSIGVKSPEKEVVFMQSPPPVSSSKTKAQAITLDLKDTFSEKDPHPLKSPILSPFQTESKSAQGRSAKEVQRGNRKTVPEGAVVQAAKSLGDHDEVVANVEKLGQLTEATSALSSTPKIESKRAPFQKGRSLDQDAVFVKEEGTSKKEATGPRLRAASATSAEESTPDLYSRNKLKPIGDSLLARRSASVKMTSATLSSTTPRPKSFKIKSARTNAEIALNTKSKVEAFEEKSVSSPRPKSSPAKEKPKIPAKPKSPLKSPLYRPHDMILLQDAENNNVKTLDSAEETTVKTTTPSETTGPKGVNYRRRREDNGNTVPSWVQVAKRRSKVWEDSDEKTTKIAPQRTPPADEVEKQDVHSKRGTGTKPRLESVEGSVRNARESKVLTQRASSAEGGKKESNQLKPSSSAAIGSKSTEAATTATTENRHQALFVITKPGIDSGSVVSKCDVSKVNNSTPTHSSHVQSNRTASIPKVSTVSQQKPTPAPPRESVASGQPSWLAIAMQKQKTWSKEEMV